MRSRTALRSTISGLTGTVTTSWALTRRTPFPSLIMRALIAINATDPPAMIALLAFAIARPMMSMLVVFNVVLARYHYASFPVYFTLAYIMDEGSAVVGVVAAFWHVSRVAGMLNVVSGQRFGYLAHPLLDAALQLSSAPLTRALLEATLELAPKQCLHVCGMHLVAWLVVPLKMWRRRVDFA